MKRNRTHSSLILIPVMLSFFVMGFVDLVGVAANHMKVDFELSDTMANLCPAMVFFMVSVVFDTGRNSDELYRTTEDRAVEFVYYDSFLAHSLVAL